MTMKLPAFQFYPADWRKDPGVQSLTYHDRGVWFEILCLMHESEQRGKLLLNGAPMPDEALARLLGLDKQILTKTLTTLLSYGVATRDEESGALVNRRMVKDEELRKIRQEAGKKGGNPILLNQNSNQNGEPALTKNQPLQSSSSSSNKNPALRAVASSDSEGHKRLFSALQDRAGPISDGAAQGKAVKWLLSHYDEQACVDCLDALRGEDWRKTRVSWLTVQKEIGAWLARRAAPPKERTVVL